MKTVSKFALFMIFAFLAQNLSAQEGYQHEIDSLKTQKERITLLEKEALKKEVETIVARQKNGEITQEEANLLKQEAATKHALNIENRLAIIDNKIAFIERNKSSGNLEFDTVSRPSRIAIGVGIKDTDNGRTFGVKYWNGTEKRPVVYDRRTYSDFVVAFGINNAIIEGQSLSDSPYELGGSRFFEMGIAWRTRVFQNSNFMRFSYGFSFQFNGLNPKDNQYFVATGPETVLETFPTELRKSKLRVDNLVIPLYLEFGPSKVIRTDTKIRYSIRNQFRLGIGGYGGFNLGARQKLKYDQNGERVKDKLKRGYKTNDIVYGVGAYVGIDGVLLYTKYDLNPLFRDATIEQRNISFGLRFDLD